LEEQSYRYAAEIVLEVKDPPATAAAAAGEATPPQAPPAFKFTSIIIGDVEDGANTYVHVSNDAGGGPTITAVVEDEGRIWLQRDGIWTEQPSGGRSLVPYRPSTLCAALAPDVNTAVMSATTEEVAGIEALRIAVSDFAPEFAARAPDFGPGSDVAGYVDDYSGTIWVAKQGGYIMKIDLVGEGAYDNGAPLVVAVKYEISLMGSNDIKVEPPV
jgi:hypothetical protein